MPEMKEIKVHTVEVGRLALLEAKDAMCDVLKMYDALSQLEKVMAAKQILVVRRLAEAVAAL